MKTMQIKDFEKLVREQDEDGFLIVPDDEWKDKC